MRKFFILLIATSCFFEAFVGISQTIADEGLKEVRIGALLPVSGDYAQYGTELWRGMELASSIRDEGKRPIKLILEDSGTMTGRTAVSAAEKLVNIDHVSVLAVLGSDDVQPITGIGLRSEVPILSLWDNSNAMKAMGDFVFCNGFALERTAKIYAQHARKSLSLRRAAIIGNHTSWSTAITAAFREDFKEEGGEVVFEELFNDEITDFRAVVPRLLQQKPELVFLPLSLPGSVSAAIRQLRQGGFRGPIFAGEAFVGETMKQLGEKAEGVYVGWLPAPPKSLIDQYTAKYGSPPWDGAIVEVGYSGAMAVFDSIDKSQQPSVRQALADHFGPSRSSNKQYTLYSVRNGKFEPVR